MSCGHNEFSNDCVCSTLISVAEAQERIEEDCRTGCMQSIDELKGRLKMRNFDTIPVLLSCNCNPFSAAGAVRSHCGEKMFNVVRSFLFRVNFVDEDTCCATLELLKPVKFHRHHDESHEMSHNDSSSHHDNSDCCETAYDEFLEALNCAKKIVRTGICVTVDLKAMTAATCLPPIHTNQTF
ncbi:CotY/CotZ family spore coat protein [Bacillus massiliigorillae]|uniref:CotY/CotZ family spore coat protein n=1 Tax=Bacillus massiliigorillae TaxID=1243664 RepID=UPI0003A2C16F|nr:CotY/CotZ family spore coat protein [Bacillus massiliigorillae]